MATVLYSKKGKFIARIEERLLHDSDGICHLIIETNTRFASLQRAIKNARKRLAKKRKKYEKTHIRRRRTKPVKRTVRVRRKRTKPVLQKRNFILSTNGRNLRPLNEA